MEPSSTISIETKYQKLAVEYSKLRAQATVLKRAVISEQEKTSALRDVLRQKETALRRSEQEVDSLNFRNKQMERRIFALQDDLNVESKKSTSKHKTASVKDNPSATPGEADHLVFEELQKKIIENAQITSLIDDKNRELDFQNQRLTELENALERRTSENNDTDRKFRKEIDQLTTRNSELETKLVEAASILGSEDTLSVAGSESIPFHHSHHSNSNEERVAVLEKEILHWRTQYEILKLNNEPITKIPPVPLTASAASGIVVQLEGTSTASTNEVPTKEQILFNKLSNNFENLLKDKCVAESRLFSIQTECEHLQHCLENFREDLKSKDTELSTAGRDIQTLEEDLATTRINYEEQISVLTEQVISLSDQLAACK